MTSFDHILNWKLKSGSHTFPGRDGGTCINEAAIVAAGFEYRAVTSADDMPPCFSRPICRLAMRLNDEATDAQRQRLLPYVTRLACADVEAVEAERAAYIRARMAGRVSFEDGLAVLAGALAIGRQADDLDAAEIGERMSAAKGRAGGSPSVAAESQAALVTSWAWVRRKVKVA